MSMLAAPRRKQKISTLNPNGLNFIDDESNIGQKLVKGMGWEKGSGLGKDKQGIANPIKIKRNADNRGIGCDHKLADNWIAHQEDFNALLADLNADDADKQANVEIEPVKVSSLEMASKKSKTRLHYQKFARGKDLSSKSDKDLAMIFGQRSNSSTPAPRSDLGSKVESDNENNDGADPFLSDFKTHTSTVSLQDYFAAKMASRGNSRVSSNNDLSEKGDTPSPLTASEVTDSNQLSQTSFFIGDDLNSGNSNHSSNEVTVKDFKSQREKVQKKKKRRHEEEYKHKSGGKTKPKPINDSMTFVSDESNESNGGSLLQKDMEVEEKRRKNG